MFPVGKAVGRCSKNRGRGLRLGTPEKQLRHLLFGPSPQPWADENGGKQRGRGGCRRPELSSHRHLSRLRERSRSQPRERARRKRGGDFQGDSRKARQPSPGPDSPTSPKGRGAPWKQNRSGNTTHFHQPAPTLSPEYRGEGVIFRPPLRLSHQPPVAQRWAASASGGLPQGGEIQLVAEGLPIGVREALVFAGPAHGVAPGSLNRSAG